MYYVKGYDKDAGVYKEMERISTYWLAVDAARSFMHYHKDVKEICREDTGEPFDWFGVFDDHDKLLMMFTLDAPDGVEPDKI